MSNPTRIKGSVIEFQSSSESNDILLKPENGKTLCVKGDLSGNLKIPDGSVALPSLSFINDTTSGIYRNTALPGNVISFSADGIDAMTVRKKFATTSRLTVSELSSDSITGTRPCCLKLVPDPALNLRGEEGIKIQISDTKPLIILASESFPSGNTGPFITADGTLQTMDINLSGGSVTGIRAPGNNIIDLYTGGTNRVVIDSNDTTINNSLTSNNGFCRTTNPAGGTIINVNRNVFTTATMFPAAVTGGNSPPTYTTGSGRMLINKAGKYLVQANYGFVFNASGGRAFNLWKVSPSATLAYISLTANVDDRTVVNMSATLDLIVGDELYLTLYHNSATFTITSDNAVPANFSALRIG